MMRMPTLLLLPVCLSIAACGSSMVSELREETLNTITQAPTADLLTMLTTLPPGVNIQTSRLVLQTFFDSYNRHDLTGVLATLSETFTYGDCDFVRGQMFVFETKEDLAIWLQTKFADGDHFRVDEMIIAPADGSPANDPRSIAVKVLRTSEILKDQKRPSLFKSILSTEGNRIQYLNTYGNVDCEAGR